MSASTILIILTAGLAVLMAAAFVGFILFYFTGYPNGISRWFGLSLLTLSFFAAMSIAKYMFALQTQNLSPDVQGFYYWYWTREATAVWLLNLTVLGLGIYLLRHRHD